MKPKITAPEFAEHWAAELGARPLSLKRLQGGINNQVFRCGQAGEFWVIKGYGPAKPGQNDRMQAEVEFLGFAAQAAPNFTPALIHVDRERRCAVLEHIEGKTFREDVGASEAAVNEAVEFFRQLNAQYELAQRSINLRAAEGYLSLHEHLNNVHERLNRMTCVHLYPHLRPHAETLLSQLDRALAETEKSTSSMISRGIVADTISPELLCISPSDFGFHNAIQSAKGIYFIDFEFAGWDDPAKASYDFILQPRVPVAKQPSPLLGALALENREIVSRRCKAIGPILELKWVCIQLAVLQPERLEEILVNLPEQTASTVVKKRLEKAGQYFRQVRGTTG